MQMVGVEEMTVVDHLGVDRLAADGHTGDGDRHILREKLREALFVHRANTQRASHPPGGL